ncbi:MAG TPA: FAD-dependent oxidoreductase [Alphaproteobacteria bacterium]|nr:FAD-dependent oxidoreductase [Alphaproteobacteria bacterium]
MNGTSRQKVTVIGAGIVGTVAANYLLREGHEVTLIDRAGPGEATSFGNAGGITCAAVVPIAYPGMIKDIPGWLLDPNGPLYLHWSYLPQVLPWLIKFLRAGRRDRVERISKALATLNIPTFDAYRPLLKDAGLEHLFHQTGQLFVYRSKRAFERDRFGIDLKRATGLRLDVLDGDEIRQLEPSLAPIFPAAYFIPDNGHCKNPFRLVQGLAEYFVRRGGALVREEVLGFEMGARGPGTLITRGGRRASDVTVIAAGVWSNALTKQLGFDVPIITQRGYHVTLPDPGVMPRIMVLPMDNKIAITPMEMGLRLAGTVELAKLESPPNYARAKCLLRIGREIFPGLRTEGYTEWMGNRPCFPDSLPVLGPVPGLGDTFVAFGHGHHGLLSASQTGKVIAELIGGRPPSIDLTPFRIDRFSKNS